jgi:flagellar hook assembly protein FlgD
VKSQGAAALAIRNAEARDTENRAVALDGLTAGAPGTGVTTATGLAMSRPSPFRESTTLEYSLAKAGSVQLSIYSVDGRRIRSLVSGPSGAGTFRIAWDGRDEAHHAMPAGMYYARLVTNDGHFTRTLIRVR